MDENVEEIVMDHGSEIEVLDQITLLDKGDISKFDCRSGPVKTLCHLLKSMKQWVN